MCNLEGAACALGADFPLGLVLDLKFDLAPVEDGDVGRFAWADVVAEWSQDGEELEGPVACKKEFVGLGCLAILEEVGAIADRLRRKTFGA